MAMKSQGDEVTLNYFEEPSYEDFEESIYEG